MNEKILFIEEEVFYPFLLPETSKISLKIPRSMFLLPEQLFRVMKLLLIDAF